MYPSPLSLTNRVGDDYYNMTSTTVPTQCGYLSTQRHAHHCSHVMYEYPKSHEDEYCNRTRSYDVKHVMSNNTECRRHKQSYYKCIERDVGLYSKHYQATI